jgi:dsRNA-specific ribonuclease
MAKTIAGRLSEAFEYSVVYLFEKVDDVAENMSEEDGRDIATFDALKKSLRAVPHELMEQTIQLRAQNPKAFENSVRAMCAAICDTFRPATAAEFVEMLNKDMRSEIKLSRSKGRDYADAVRRIEASSAAPVSD